MGKTGKKPVIGLLGGMCAGKSTVAAEFAKLGCAVIDADEIVHQLLDEKEVRAKVVRLFGKEVLDDKGVISRTELANKVFSDPSKLAKLTGVLHPLVLARVEHLIADYKARPEVKAIVLDMPLLMEVEWEKRCDRIIFVDCKPPIRLERAKKTGFFDADMLKIRENLQISLDKKKRIADNIVDNNSDLSGLSKQIACLFSNIVDGE
ncbi:MAG: dephospho-CoA kinase [Sedimentisphaerales bacterium]|jgi:dephospho-CoA kinase